MDLKDFDNKYDACRLYDEDTYWSVDYLWYVCSSGLYFWQQR